MRIDRHSQQLEVQEQGELVRAHYRLTERFGCMSAVSESSARFRVQPDCR